MFKMCHYFPSKGHTSLRPEKALITNQSECVQDTLEVEKSNSGIYSCFGIFLDNSVKRTIRETAQGTCLGLYPHLVYE